MLDESVDDALAGRHTQNTEILRFKIPSELPGTWKGVVTFAGILVAEATLVKWRSSSELHEVAELSTSFCRPRLVSACRLQLQIDCSSFFLNKYEVCFRITGDDNKDVVLSVLTPSGQQLLEELDLVASTDSATLIDGTAEKVKRSSSDTRVIAFYLPQFFPFSENDRWWGEGFTEWSNVVDAKPQLKNHKMPLFPSDLGFYDLRVEDTRRRQAELAERYGVDGFCYYFYWFSGRRLMREVLDEILSSGEPSTDFCLCWANESWSRRWDGTEGAVDLLIGQKHDPEVDKSLIADLMPFLRDQRYITIDGSPLILVYRLDIMREPEQVFAAWRHSAHAAGFPGLVIAAVRSFGLTDESASSVDAIVDFPPHTAVSSEIQSELAGTANFRGKVYDYRQVVIDATTRKPGTKLTFPGIMPRWDNTARKGDRAHIFWNSTPSAFKLWFKFALQQSQQLPLGKRLLFINSWNEWGEGAMLEPDRIFGRAYLEALRSVRGGYVLGPSDTSKFALISQLEESQADELMRSFSAEVQLVSQIMASQRLKAYDAFRPGRPEIVELAPSPCLPRDGMVIIDHSSSKEENNSIPVRYGQPISFIGWAMMDRTSPHPWGRVAYLVASSTSDASNCFHIPVVNWSVREDVARYYGMSLPPSDCYFGFELVFNADILTTGTYRMEIVQAVAGELISAPCVTTMRRVLE